MDCITDYTQEPLYVERFETRIVRCEETPARYPRINAAYAVVVEVPNEIALATGKRTLKRSVGTFLAQNVEPGDSFFLDLYSPDRLLWYVNKHEAVHEQKDPPAPIPVFDNALRNL